MLYSNEFAKAPEKPRGKLFLHLNMGAVGWADNGSVILLFALKISRVAVCMLYLCAQSLLNGASAPGILELFSAGCKLSPSSSQQQL